MSWGPLTAEQDRSAPLMPTGTEMVNLHDGGVPFTASLAEREPLEGWGRRAAAGEESRLNRPQRAQFQVLGEGSRLTGEDLTA